EGFDLREWLRLKERRPVDRVVADERELFHPVDGEEDRGMRGVEDLVPLPGKAAQDTEEMPLCVRAEIELGLLDQEHEAAQVGCEEPLHPHYELKPAVSRGPVMRSKWRCEELGDVCGAVTRRGRDKRA